MIPVQNLSGAWEMFVGEAPNPVCAIADHNDPLRLVNAATLGFNPEMTTKSFRITEVGIK